MAGIRGDQVNLYLQDMYKAERESYGEEDTMFDKIFKTEKAKKAAGDKCTQILGAGDLKRHTAEDQDIDFKSPIEGWQYLTKYHTFSDGIALSKEAVEDTTKLGNLLKDLATSWGRSIRVLKETFAARVFNDGGDLAGNWIFNGSHIGNADSSGDLLYDSKPLFNLTGNARSTKGGGTYYNAVANLALNPANFETVYNLHKTSINRDERDRVIRNSADTLLVQPGAERFKAERILDTTKGIPNSQLNDTNVYYKLLTVMDWDYLTDGAGGSYPAFYVGKKQHSDFVFRHRQEPEIRFFRDENNLGYRTSVNLRIGIFLKNFRCWSRGGGTSA